MPTTKQIEARSLVHTDVVLMDDQEWIITGITWEYDSDNYFTTCNRTIELAIRSGARMTLEVPDHFKLTVKVPEPWEGLKPGDLLYPANKPGVLLLFLGMGDHEPFLMTIPKDVTPTIVGVTPTIVGVGQIGYCNWSWYEKHYGSKLKRVTAKEWSTSETVGLNYYRNLLNMKELK